jgi:tight adherence protein C
MLTFGIVGLGAGLALVVYTLLAQADEKATVRGSLRQLEGYEVESVRDQELLVPLRDRAVAPVFGGLTSLGKRFTPVGYVEKVRHKFVLAGSPAQQSIDQFLAIRVITFAMGLALVGYLLIASPFHGMLKLAALAFAVLLFGMGPDAIVNRRVEERQHELRIKLPDVLDLLTISVEAGLGFEQALDRVVSAVPGPLSDEFSRMLGEVRAGSTRADAMRALETRTNVPEVRSFVLAILQADTFGVSIGRVLRAQADEMRIKRRQMAQERAMKAPVKMLIPMVFCIFPALFIIVLGPAVINIYDNF